MFVEPGKQRCRVLTHDPLERVGHRKPEVCGQSLQISLRGDGNVATQAFVTASLSRSPQTIRSLPFCIGFRHDAAMIPVFSSRINMEFWKALIHPWSNMNDYLNDMALFVEVVKAKGFRRAAESLEMPNSTLSRRITNLEKAIGLRLLHRTTRRLELTEAGQVYYSRCKRIVDEARLAHEHLNDMVAQPSGLLRASMSVDFSQTYLAPLIAEFSRLYPAVSFDLDLTPRRVDMISDPFDVAIRMGESGDSQLIARPITTLVPELYASPGYLDTHGEPETPEDLSSHQCLTMLRAASWSLTDGSRSTTVPVSGRFSLNNIGLIRRFSTLDLGIAMVSKGVMAEEVANGRLRRILPAWQGHPQVVYALTESRLLPAKTQRFIDFLRDRLA